MSADTSDGLVNWAGNHAYRAERLHRPSSLEQLREADVPAELVDQLTAEPVAGLVTVTCDVALKAPGEVPRSQGKAVRVKDLRAKKP